MQESRLTIVCYEIKSHRDEPSFKHKNQLQHLRYYYPCEATIDDVTISDHVIGDLAFAQTFPIKAVVWPAVWAREKAYLTKGIPIHQQFYYYGDSKNLAHASLVIDIPKGIKLSGVYQAQSNNVYAEKPEITAMERVRDGQKYIRYIIPILKLNELQTNLPSNPFNHGLYLEPGPEFRTGECNLYWHLVANQKESDENTLKAVILPELPAWSNPKDFSIFPFFYGSMVKGSGGLLRYHPSDDQAIGDKLRNVCRKIGIKFGRPGYAGGVGNFDIEPCDWFHYGITVDGKAHAWAQGKDLGKPRIDAAGNELSGFACPTYIIQQGINVDPLILKTVKQDYKNIKRVVIDFEVRREHQECFCKNCLDAFAKGENLQNQPLTGKRILSEHANAWEKFQCQQNAGLAKVVCSIARAANPEVEILFCSDCVYSDDFSLKISVDVRLYDAFVDAHMPMIYFAGPTFYQLIGNTIHSLKKPVMPYLVNIDHVWNLPLSLSPSEFRMDLLAAATAGAKGIGVYPGLEGFDGEFYVMLNQTMHEIAILEDFFSKGTRNDTFMQTESQTRATVFHNVRSYNNEYLFSLFNYGKQKTLIKILISKLAPGIYTLYDPITRERFSSGHAPSWTDQELKNGVTISIAPENVRFLVLAKYNASVKYKTSVSQAEIQGSVIPAVVPPVFPEVSGKNAQISGDDLDGDGVPEIKITTPAQQVWIDYQGGARVAGWAINGKPLLTHADHLYNRLFWDLFYPTPGWGGEFGGAYEIMENKVEGNRVVIALRKQLQKGELKGLMIEKTYYVKSDSAMIEVKYRFKNLSRETLTIAFWSHSVPDFNGQEWKMVVPTKDGMSIVNERQKMDVVYTQDQGGHKENTFANNWVAAFSAPQKAAIVFTFSAADVSQLYFWRGFPVQTVEWMYNAVTLKPNEAWETKIGISFLAEFNAVSGISSNSFL